MITSEKVFQNGREFKRTFSTKGYQIECEGEIFVDAYDAIDTDRVYTEVIPEPTEGVIPDDN